MGDQNQKLSLKAITVLEMIAAGSSYEQILAACPHLTYLDIFHAATEALDLAAICGTSQTTYQVADIRKTYPRAYEKWTDEEHIRLQNLIESGLTVAQISHRLQRQRSAIRSRIVKLDLVNGLSPAEQSELARICKLDPTRPDPSVESEDEA